MSRLTQEQIALVARVQDDIDARPVKPADTRLFEGETGVWALAERDGVHVDHIASWPALDKDAEGTLRFAATRAEETLRDVLALTAPAAPRSR